MMITLQLHLIGRREHNLVTDLQEPVHRMVHSKLRDRLHVYLVPNQLQYINRVRYLSYVEGSCDPEKASKSVQRMTAVLSGSSGL
jgi:hypothetical protein